MRPTPVLGRVAPKRRLCTFCSAFGNRRRAYSCSPWLTSSTHGSSKSNFFVGVVEDSWVLLLSVDIASDSVLLLSSVRRLLSRHHWHLHGHILAVVLVHQVHLHELLVVLLNGNLLLNDDLLVVDVLLLKSHLFELLHRYHWHHRHHSRHLRRSHLWHLSRLNFFHLFLRLDRSSRFSFNWLLSMFRLSFFRRNLLLSFRFFGSVHLLAFVSARLCLPLFLRALVSWLLFNLACIIFLGGWLFDALRHFNRFLRHGNGLLNDSLDFLGGRLFFS